MKDAVAFLFGNKDEHFLFLKNISFLSSYILLIPYFWNFELWTLPWRLKFPVFHSVLFSSIKKVQKKWLKI